MRVKKKSTPNKKGNRHKLKINDDILVQVIKEPFSGKGPRVTTDISIPGSLMVLVPNESYIGISRKINDRYEKEGLGKLRKNLSQKDLD